MALVCAKFNGGITERLLDGALAGLEANGVKPATVTVAWVPGAFELPLAATRLAESGAVDAVVALGAVIRGETAHFDFVAGECASGLQRVALDTGVPVVFGVLTTDTVDQALDRCAAGRGQQGLRGGRDRARDGRPAPQAAGAGRRLDDADADRGDRVLQTGPAQGLAREGDPRAVRRRRPRPWCGAPTSTTGPRIDDPRVDEVRILRPQEIPGYVAEGLFDLGITGRDWIEETGAEVVSLGELGLLEGHGQPHPGRAGRGPGLAGDDRSRTCPPGARVSTEYPELTRRVLEKHGVHAEIRLSYGATEAKIPDIADAVVEITETGRALAAAGLRIVETLLVSRTELIANPLSAADPVKRHAMGQLLTLLQGALEARGKVLLKLNVAGGELERRAVACCPR